MGDKPYVCGTCGETFKSWGKMKIHEDTVHLNIKNTCYVCGNNFGSKPIMKRHIRQVHLGIKRKSWEKKPKRCKIIFYLILQCVGIIFIFMWVFFASISSSSVTRMNKNFFLHYVEKCNRLFLFSLFPYRKKLHYALNSKVNCQSCKKTAN